MGHASPQPPLLHWDVGHVEVVVACPRVPNAGIARNCAVSRRATAHVPRADVDVYVQNLALESVDAVSQSSPHDGDSTTPMHPVEPYDERIGVRLEARQEVAAIAPDTGEELISKVAEVEQKQPVPNPLAYMQNGPVMGALSCDLDRLFALASHAHHDMGLERGFRVVRSAGGERRCQHVMQANHRRVRQQDVRERRQRALQRSPHPGCCSERARPLPSTSWPALP